MVSCDDIKNKIESILKGSEVIVNNPRGDDVHFSVIVTFEGFKNKNRIEQHRMVYNCISPKFSDCGMSLHALQIKTIIKNN